MPYQFLDFQFLIFYCVGSQRRTKKIVHHDTVKESKELKSCIKKFGMQQLQDIDEVNMFKDDNTVIHLKKPQSKYTGIEIFVGLPKHTNFFFNSPILRQRKPPRCRRKPRDQIAQGHDARYP